MKKKIALIIERADIALGGAERSGFELAGALSTLGFEVDILTTKGRTKAENIHVQMGLIALLLEIIIIIGSLLIINMMQKSLAD